MAKLKCAMTLANDERRAEATNNAWRLHTQIVRGGAVRKFSGLEFDPVD